MKSKAVRIVLIVLAIIVVTVLALPFLISGNQFRPTLENELAKTLGRPVKIGNLELSLLSGGLRADDIAIAEDPAFGKDPFLRAKSLAVGVDLPALIFSRQVNVRSVTVNNPDVNLIRSGTRWNFSSLGQSEPKTESKSPEFAVGKVAIDNGRITLRDTQSAGKPTIYEKVSFKATDLAPSKSFPFTLSAVAPSGGKLTLDGTAGPVSKTDSARTPLTAKFNIDSYDLARTEFIGPASGISGVVNADGTVRSDGSVANVEMKGRADRLQLVKGGSPSATPVNVDAVARYDLKRQLATISRGTVKTGAAVANLTGTLNAAGRTPTVDMRVTGREMPLSDIQSLLPAVGVNLPTGSSLQGGTATADLALVGPVDRLVTNGAVNIANTRLAGFSFAEKLGAISKLLGSGSSTENDTTIQTLSADLQISPEGIRADKINLILPAVGACTGNGVISPSNTLNFKMVAKLNAATGSGGNLLGALTQRAGLSGGSASLPFLIQGTTARPVFVPDIAGLAGSSLKVPGQQNVTEQPTANPVEDILGGFFGKKKR